LSISFFSFKPFANVSVKTKLRLSAVVTISLALVVALTVLLSSMKIEEATKMEDFAVEVIQNVSDLNSLSYAYLLLQDKRPRGQWQLRHRSLGKLLAEHAITTPDEESLIARLRSNHQQMKNIFDVLVKGTEEGRTGEKRKVHGELSEALTTQLMARSEMIVKDASLLKSEATQRMYIVRKRSVFLVLVSIFLLILPAGLTSSLLARGIGTRMSELERGTRQVAAGDLGYRFAVTGTDEIGRLSSAFNEMTAKLSASYEAIRRQADLIELSHEAIIVKDLDNRILFWSNGAEEIYGWTKAEALGSITHSFLKTQFPVPFDEYTAVLTGQGRWEGELVHKKRGGSNLTVLSKQVLQRDEAGTPVGIMEINIDITERKRAEDETRKHAAQLEVSNRELQDFAFVASHDLQEPLRKIQAFGDRLKTRCSAALGPEGTDYLERMQNAAARMQTLIQSLLNYSRVTTKARPFSRTDLAASVREAVGNLEASIRDTNGRVEVEELVTIDADPVQMVQLFQNLIGNALKFHGEERPVVKVYGLPVEPDTKKARSRDRAYTIFIKDNGIGFDEKYLDRIFTPFQRLHGRGVYEGTGIGLAICRKIADRHGGTITAKSTQGEGTTFIVSLPVKQPKGETE
jgi:PAS domain S-box-containing protein